MASRVLLLRNVPQGESQTEYTEIILIVVLVINICLFLGTGRPWFHQEPRASTLPRLQRAGICNNFSFLAPNVPQS